MGDPEHGCPVPLYTFHFSSFPAFFWDVRLTGKLLVSEAACHTLHALAGHSKDSWREGYVRQMGAQCCKLAFLQGNRALL